MSQDDKQESHEIFKDALKLLQSIIQKFHKEKKSKTKERERQKKARKLYQLLNCTKRGKKFF